MFQIFKEHQGFGKQIMLLAKNELIKKYKGAVIGPLWSVVKPLFTLFVYWFAFEVGLKGAGPVKVVFPELGNAGGVFEYSRFLFMLVGFIPWFFINESIVEGAKSIRLNRQFVNKVSFPVSTIMTYTSVARLYVHIFLLGLMYLYVTFVGGVVKLPGMEEAVSGGITPSLYNLQILFYLPLMFIFFLVLSWSTAPMSAFSRDFENMIVSVMAGIFWLSGIIYDSYLLYVAKGSEAVPTWLRHAMLFNPINFFANGYRNCFLYHRWFWDYKTELFVFLAELAVIFLLGIFNYNRLRKRLPDVL